MMLKRVTISFLVLTATALLFLASCKKADINFGSQYLDPRTDIVRIDTFTPMISTVYVDSFVTANSGTGLLGQYTDPYLGKVTAQSFYEMTIPSGTAPTLKASYDSLMLLVVPDRSYYGDTTKPFQLTLNQLGDNIVLRNSAISFYNTSSVVKGDLIGQGNLTVRPNFDDTIRLRLSDAWGQKLFTMLRDKTPEVQNNDNFIQYFKGLCLSAAGSTGMIIGVKDSIQLRVCYREPDPGYNYQRQLNFTLVNSNHQFNNITVDRNGTALGKAQFGFINREIPSTATADMAFSQYLTSSMIKVRFPSIRDIGFVKGFNKIMSAQLVIRPIKNSIAQDSLPPQLYLANTDVGNGIGTPLASTTSGTASAQTGNLFYDFVNNNVSYTYDMTAYLQQQLVTVYDPKVGLLIVPPSPHNTTRFNRLVAGDALQGIDSRIQLIVYYLAIH